MQGSCETCTSSCCFFHFGMLPLAYVRYVLSTLLNTLSSSTYSALLLSKSLRNSIIYWALWTLRLNFEDIYHCDAPPKILSCIHRWSSGLRATSPAYHVTFRWPLAARAYHILSCSYVATIIIIVVSFTLSLVHWTCMPVVHTLLRMLLQLCDVKSSATQPSFSLHQILSTWMLLLQVALWIPQTTKLWVSLSDFILIY